MRRAESYEEREHWYDHPRILRYVVTQLRAGKSPDAIAGRMKRASPWHRAHAVSHESIYRYIWKVKEEGGAPNQSPVFARFVRELEDRVVKLGGRRG